MGGREGGEIDPWRLGHCPMDREKIEEKTEKQRSRGEEKSSCQVGWWKRTDP